MKNFRQQIIQALLTVVAVSVTATTAIAGPGNYNQQGPKLVGTGAVGFSAQGYSVALSADGNTALVGGPEDNASGVNSLGAAWVFTRSNGIWTQQGEKLAGTGAVVGCVTAPLQGFSVALSADGNTAVVGGPNDDSCVFYIGAVWMFTRSHGVWTQQGEKLIGTGATNPARQGFAVAVSADGNTLAESGIDADFTQGAVWVFTRTNDIWTQQGERLVPTPAPGRNSSVGQSIALSADGNTLAMAGSFVPTFVFTRSNGIWTQQGPGLSSGIGAYVSLTADGDRLLSGGYLFKRHAGIWSQSGSQLTLGPNGEFPTVLSADGNTAVSGGHLCFCDPHGGVLLFVRTGGWHLQNIYPGGDFSEISTKGGQSLSPPMAIR